MEQTDATAAEILKYIQSNPGCQTADVARELRDLAGFATITTHLHHLWKLGELKRKAALNGKTETFLYWPIKHHNAPSVPAEPCLPSVNPTKEIIMPEEKHAHIYWTEEEEQILADLLYIELKKQKAFPLGIKTPIWKLLLKVQSVLDKERQRPDTPHTVKTIVMRFRSMVEKKWRSEQRAENKKTKKLFERRTFSEQTAALSSTPAVLTRQEPQFFNRIIDALVEEVLSRVAQELNTNSFRLIIKNYMSKG